MLILDLSLVVLIVICIFCCFLLSRQIEKLQADKNSLVEVVDSLKFYISQADSSIENLKTTNAQVSRDLVPLVAAAKSLHNNLAPTSEAKKNNQEHYKLLIEKSSNVYSEITIPNAVKQDQQTKHQPFQELVNHYSYSSNISNETFSQEPNKSLVAADTSYNNYYDTLRKVRLKS